MKGVPPSGSGCQPTALAAEEASSQSGIPNAALLEGERYSPNLRKWFRSRRCGSLLPQTQVFLAPDGTRYIGRRFEDDDWLHGAQLMRVLCIGSKAETWAYSPKQSGDWKPIEGFWERYAAVGRCAIDQEHTGWWHGERWNENGDVRTCRWCGFEQHKVRWTETVKRERWEAASADTRPEGGDSTKIEAPFTSGAVPHEDEADAQTPSPSSRERK